MKKVFNKCFIILGVILNIQMVNAQRVALKSNLIDWATLSPNLAVEMRLNQRLTLDISAAANPFSFTIADMKATHFRFQPELRYWFNRPMARHFMGISLLGGLYNVSRHWNMEATLGIGMAKLRAFDYREGEEKPATPNLSKWSPVPIRLGLSFSYIFK